VQLGGGWVSFLRPLFCYPVKANRAYAIDSPLSLFIRDGEEKGRFFIKLRLANIAEVYIVHR
jgi:hypothetical protein